MIKLFGIANSDQVNKYNMKFSVGALEHGYSNSWRRGVPSYINHDRTKPLGWTKLRSLYFEPGMVRTTSACYIPETDNEAKILNTKMYNFFQHSIGESESILDQLKEKLKGYLSDNYQVYSLGSVSICDEGIVERVFPHLFKDSDKHGLIDLRQLNPVLPGVFEIKGFLIFASKFFRRSFSRLNTLNTPFLDSLQKATYLQDVQVKISIDRDLIGLAGTQYKEFEFQYWWGPKFDDSLDKIPLGVTVHENENYEMVFNSILRTEFWWYQQDEKKTFECEELLDVPNIDDQDDMIGCRFVHSMLESDSEKPDHLDGAIRIYDLEKMIERIDISIDDSGRNTIYHKLWRIDGAIEINLWKELLNHYFRDNRLIGEYFGGVDEYKEFIPHKVEEEIQKTPIERYVPYNMKQGEGIRMAITYTDKTNREQNDDLIRIRPNKAISIGSVSHKYIESDTLEIVKLLKAAGKNIFVLGGIKVLAFEDTMINFPTFIHRGNNSVQNANQTNVIVSKLCKKWIDRSHDRIISYTIGVEYEDLEVLYSITGHIGDIFEWINSEFGQFPNTMEKMGDWCESFSMYLNENYPTANDNPKIGEVLNDSGILCLERKMIDPDFINYEWDKKKNALMAEIRLERDEQDLMEEIKNKGLEIATVHLINHSECSKCKKEYMQCGCSKYFEPDVCQIMKNTDMLGSFWTNRKA